MTVLTVKKTSKPNEDQESDVEIDDLPQLDGNLEIFNGYTSASTISLSQLIALMEKENKQREREREHSKYLEDFKRNFGLYTRLEPFAYCSFSLPIYAWTGFCNPLRASWCSNPHSLKIMNDC